MFCVIDHGPRTSAMRMTSGASFLVISMAVRRFLALLTRTGVPTFNLAVANLALPGDWAGPQPES